ncbi:tyrosine-type recombinase/integrase [Desulfofarcimen acetoxidans]|uniref:tyrosine-type recombinase/integrase n=1 Tax=Desulfofarcimen acetoxidans TaxID=58138 RepID=UPI00019E64D2|nr:tyrosine-type recombinase/integrase [Desulfofarcimen acetoxidans]
MFKKAKIEQNKTRLAYGEQYQDSDLVFTQEDGIPQHPDIISSWFPQFMKRNGLPRITFHGLRHTHTSLLLKSVESLKLICDRLGHSGIGITSDTYTHLMPRMQKNAVEKLEELIFLATLGTKWAPKTQKSLQGLTWRS